MKDINVPFSVYDFFAIFLPGAVFLLILYVLVGSLFPADLHQSLFRFFTDGGIFALSLALILCYATGHIVAVLSYDLEAISDRLFGQQPYLFLSEVGLLNYKPVIRIGDRWAIRSAKRTVGKISSYGTILREQATARWGEGLSPEHLWSLCKAVVREKQPTSFSLAQSFLTIAGMCRGLAFIFFLPTLVLLLEILVRSHSVAETLTVLVFLVICATLTVAFLGRMRAYQRYYTEETFHAFLAYCSIEESRQKPENHVEETAS